jgi:hypothetical protein
VAKAQNVLEKSRYLYYPENVRAEMYLVSLAHDLIKSRIIPNNFVKVWKGDYLNDVRINEKLVSTYS